jgi:hypothetical protein
MPRYSVPELSLTRMGRPSTDLRKSDGDRWLLPAAGLALLLPVASAAACYGIEGVMMISEDKLNSTGQRCTVVDQCSTESTYRLGIVSCLYRLGRRHDRFAWGRPAVDRSCCMHATTKLGHRGCLCYGTTLAGIKCIEKQTRRITIRTGMMMRHAY